MPELPEVDAVARRLHEWAAGRTMVAAHFTRPQTTRPLTARVVAKKLAGRRIERVTRRAKNVLIALDSGLTMRVHLGMTGNLYAGEVSLKSAATRAWFPLDDGRELIFDDSRLFGRIQALTPDEVAALDKEYGPEPLSEAFTPDWLMDAAKRSARPAKVFLLDQTNVVGLGNIWAAEALFGARVHPSKPMNRLGRRKIEALHASIRDVLGSAVNSAYREYSRPGATPESEGFGVAVYGREGLPCLRCGKRIRRVAQAGRSTYFCPGCQR
jgi:formamidopyrimidine-DNA glycosylase